MIRHDDIDPRLLAAMVAAVRYHGEEEKTNRLAKQELRPLKPWRLVPWRSLGTGLQSIDLGWRRNV